MRLLLQRGFVEVPGVRVLMIDENLFKKLNDFFSIYKLGFIQDMETVLKELDRLGATNQDFHDYVKTMLDNQANFFYEQQKQREAKKREFYYKVPRCPSCGGLMVLSSVNNKPCNQIGGSAKSIWSCYDQMECGHIVESPYEINAEAERHGLEKFYPSEKELKEASKRKRRRSVERYGSPGKPQNKRPCGAGR